MKNLKPALIVGIIGGVLCLGIYVGLTRYQRPVPGISAIGGVAISGLRIEGLPYYLQHDPQWAEELIGGSQERMASVGCTISCVAMGLARHGYALDPLQLCRALKEQEGFTVGGLLLWNKIAAITNNTVTVEFPRLSHATLDTELQQGTPIIARIRLHEVVTHWVLIVGKEGLEYLIMDPLNDAKQLMRLSERSKKIHAIRVLRKVEAPPVASEDPL
jgi:Peptidase C39 family